MRWRRFWTSAVVACSRPAKRGQRAVAAWRRSGAQPGSRAARSIAACAICGPARGHWRVRCAAGRRRQAGDRAQPGLLEALNELVQSSIRGDPEAALLWVSQSQRHLAAALAAEGFTAGQKLVGRLLRRLGFSCRPTARRARVPATRTATRSSSISTPR